MTTRIALLITALAAFAPPPLSGQVEVPDSLYWLRLPDDPEEYADSIEWGTRISANAFLRVGCPSDHPWSAAVLTALENRAETSLQVRGMSRAIAFYLPSSRP